MSDLFLTNKELYDLTGYIYAKRQREWLNSKGIPFFENRMGIPKVKRCIFTQTEKEVNNLNMPDFGVLDG
ncbi:DUF4224 domain-containing protein [Enterobacteriaceae bacterium ESL0689]|nr:DUF4224 domain-containing protein [Enterobacteriaceae bacterium ESL0689]